MQSIKYFSLFSGIGGFELGIKQASTNLRNHRVKKTTKPCLSTGRDIALPGCDATAAKCVGYCEIDPYARSVYQRHFPNHRPFGDITKINPDHLPDFDLLCGGFPCQSFSIAGKRKGLEDPRGALFFDIARIIQRKHPRTLLLENVKGFLSHANGRTAQLCFEALDDLGYDCEWQVLNSKNFGLPQNRERIFIVGHSRSESRRQVFPFFRSVQDAANGCIKASVARRHKLTVRRLTPLECERVQGFPDNWTRGLSDTRRYQCLGNAVSPVVVREICRRLFADRAK